MATKFECDRCHEQSAKGNFVQRVELPILNYNNREFQTHDDDGRVKTDTKELCAECVRVLHEAWEPPPALARSMQHEIEHGRTVTTGPAISESHGSSRLERD